MLVDWASSSHLIGGDEPFVSTRKKEVSQFSGMCPPRIAIDPKAYHPGFGMATKGKVLGRRDSGSHGLGKVLL